MNWNRLYQLSCGIQHYDWGERGAAGVEPYIARLLGIEANGRPYAELWMGDHPALPARVVELPGHPSLRQLIRAHPRDILGATAGAVEVPALPFLMKVLSCEQPLSIQAHPDRERAAALHRRDPVHYPDPNHKPEIAVSLSGLEALVSFRHGDEIRADMAERPPLQEFFAEVAAAGDWLRRAYAEVFRASAEQVQAAVSALQDHLSRRVSLSRHDRVFSTCSALHPGGRGALSVYFLNHLRLQPGEALFIPPNEPHAYLNGTILECMAASDNVVRAGLTRKFVDREVLLEMLSYAEGAPRIRSGERRAPGIRHYPVPIPDFELIFHDFGAPHPLHSAGAVSVVVLLQGKVRFRVGDWSAQAQRGTVWLLPAAAATVRVKALGESAELVQCRARLPA